MSCHESSFEHFSSELYPLLLSEVISKIGINLNEIPRQLEQIIQITNNADFIMETMSVLNDVNLMDKCAKFIALLLENLLRDESYLMFSFVRLSHNELDDVKWMKIEHYIQQLISIPDKIANRMGMSFPKTFEAEAYSSILLINILKAIHTMIHINNIERFKLYEFTFVSKLISKIFVNFKFSQAPINCAIKIMSIQTAQVYYRDSLREMIKYLQRGAIDTFVQSIFGSAVHKELLLRMFGDFWKTSAEWNYVITKKIPFFNYTKNDMLIENVVYFIATQDSKVLEEMLTEMLVIWGTKSHVFDTSFEQHFYVTKFIVLMTSYMPNIKNHANSIRQYLFNGAQIHLGSTDLRLRALGMITSEVVIGIIDHDLKEDEKLKFEYGDFSRAITTDVIDVIRNFPQKRVSSTPEESIDLKGNEIDELMNELIRMSEGKESLVNVPAQKVKESAEKLPKSAKVNNPTPPVELDSDDDDLPPYPDSDSSYNRDENKPKYILDIISTFSTKDGLENAEKFETTMNCAQEVIKQQLPNNHSDIAVDLIRIFMNLQKSCYCENFEELRMNILIETCCIHPKECARYICDEFNTEITKYSMRTRILMLDVLSESAKRLSKLELPKMEAIESPKKTTPQCGLNKLTIKLQEELNNRNKRDAQRIIRERLLAKTRRLTTRTKSLNETSGINRFSSLAGYFFFPLIKGFGHQQMPFGSKTNLKHDMDNMLLVKFLNTVSILMLCAENSTVGPKMAKEIMNLSVFLRYHEESQIRLAALHMFSTILLAIPKNVLLQEFSVEINEFMNHLNMIVKSTVVNYEPDKECREFAQQLVSMCYNALFSDIQESA